MDRIVSYAQNREDVLLMGYLKSVKEGFYVDVGASDPEKYSVTKLFYDAGWHGINIEPSTYLYKFLELNRPRDININKGVSSRPGKINFRYYPKGDGLSTFSKEVQEQYEKDKSNITDNYEDISVDVVTLADIFQEYNPPQINFLKIDVEGFEYEVIEGNDWVKYRPQIICIEANHIINDWRSIITKQGYKKIFFDGINEYYVAKEAEHLVKDFSYPQTMLAVPVINADITKDFKVLNWRLRQTELKLIRQEIMTESLRSDTYQLNQQINASKRIRSLVIQLAKALNQIVLIYIAKLNRPVPQKHKAFRIEKTDPKDILIEIRKYDFDLYYSAKIKKNITFKIVNNSYLFMVRTLKSAMLHLYLIIKGRDNG